MKEQTKTVCEVVKKVGCRRCEVGCRQMFSLGGGGFNLIENSSQDGKLNSFLLPLVVCGGVMSNWRRLQRNGGIDWPITSLPTLLKPPKSGEVVKDVVQNRAWLWKLSSPSKAKRERNFRIFLGKWKWVLEVGIYKGALMGVSSVEREDGRDSGGVG